MKEEKLLTVREVSAWLGLSRMSVYRRVRAGEIPFVRVGSALRFSSSALDRMVEAKLAEGEQAHAA